MPKKQYPVAPHSRWPVVGALLAICGFYYLLPEPLTLGPGWLLLTVSVALLIPTVLTHRAGHTHLNEIFACLSQHLDPPVEQLKAASVLWAANVLLFVCWCWRLDGGGPNRRDAAGVHRDGAFLFLQMTMSEDLRGQMGGQFSQ